MRYATLQFGPDEAPGELSVIGLTTPNAGEEAYVLSNVNRWREQIQLSPIDAEQLADEAEIIPVGNADATVVQMRGIGKGTAPSAAPAGVGALPASHPSLDSATGDLARILGSDGDSPAPSTQLMYSVPAGWLQREVSGMRRAAFSVAEGDQSVEITVIDLTADAGELLPNVNRWREQIKLGETTADELANETQNIRVGTAVGDYVRLVGPADASRPQAILAAIAIQGGKAWFLKLTGDAPLAAKEEESFKSFVRSVQF
jgi:hypothetical protein